MFRNGTLDRNTGRNVKRSADVSGNARHFCDVEFNYTGYEGEWSAFDPLPKLTQVSEKDVRIIIGKERSGLNQWTRVTQRTWHKSCGYYGKWTLVL